MENRSGNWKPARGRFRECRKKTGVSSPILSILFKVFHFYCSTLYAIISIMRLPEDYIAGFVDGEGCFALNLIREVKHHRKNTPVYIYWNVEFAIELRKDDIDVLNGIKDTLECGNISVNRQGSVRYAVNDINDLLYKIIPFFEKYPLRAKKRFDFQLWKEAVEILYENKGAKTNIRTTGNRRGSRRRVWNRKDLQRLQQLGTAMKEYKSKGSAWKWLGEIEK